MSKQNSTIKSAQIDAKKRKVCHACKNPIGGWAGLSQWHNEYCKRSTARGPMRKGKSMRF
tara:strand:+ start:455 stop:634 length:180 start_codon:yes stop_codon:yes gene_type:complete